MKPIIIAEAGVNHNGSIELAKDLVAIAADAGADFVKFQTFITENNITKNAEKADYPDYFELVLQKTRPGSIILSDNVLWSGKVVEPIEKKDKVTPILLSYNKKLKEDPRVETVLLPVRDGLTLTRVL